MSREKGLVTIAITGFVLYISPAVNPPLRTALANAYTNVKLVYSYTIFETANKNLSKIGFELLTYVAFTCTFATDNGVAAANLPIATALTAAKGMLL